MSEPVQTAPWVRNPYRLWSLREMLWADVSELIRQVSIVAELALTGEFTRAEQISKAAVEDFLGMLQDTRDSCERLGMSVSMFAADDLMGILADKDQMKSDSPGFAMLAYHARHLRDSVVAEASNATWLYLDPPSARIYSQDPEEHFGKEPCMAFDSARDDLWNALRCLALEQSTACVFHLMRATEIVARAVWRGLLFPDSNEIRNNGWGQYDKDIEAEIARRTAADPHWANRQFFDEAQLFLNRAKRYWRNPTAHPEKTFDMGQARTMLRAVEGLLSEVSEHLDERGKFA